MASKKEATQRKPAPKKPAAETKTAPPKDVTAINEGLKKAAVPAATPSIQPQRAGDLPAWWNATVEAWIFAQYGK